MKIHFFSGIILGVTLLGFTACGGGGGGGDGGGESYRAFPQNPGELNGKTMAFTGLTIESITFTGDGCLLKLKNEEAYTASGYTVVPKSDGGTLTFTAQKPKTTTTYNFSGVISNFTGTKGNCVEHGASYTFTLD